PGREEPNAAMTRRHTHPDFPPKERPERGLPVIAQFVLRRTTQARKDPIIMTCKLTLSAAAFTAALAAAASAAAMTPTAVAVAGFGDNEKVSAPVRYADAETRDLQGAKKVAFRIRIAAAKVCGGDDPVVRAGEQFQRCQHAAIDRAVRDLGSPMVADAL